MAERPAQEKTEQPTPERLRRARKRGKVPQARELPSALVLITLLVVLGLFGSALFKFFFNQARQGISVHAPDEVNVAVYSRLLKTKVLESMVVILPFLIVGGFTSIFASVLGSGWSYSLEGAKLKFERLNPISGLKRLVSLRSLVTLLLSLVKLTVLLVIVWDYLDGKLETLLSLRWETPTGTLMVIARVIFVLIARISVGIMAIAAIDWIYQRWDYRRQLRMTKDELKKEMKDRELSPLIKGRIRGIQIEMVRKRMLQEVPTADVVITNPTHVAVALRYDPENMNAPTVVAKGPELLCEKIKEVARAHNVPIVHRPELARTIYNTVDLGGALPETLFVAVAEVLAMVYRARRKKLNTRK